MTTVRFKEKLTLPDTNFKSINDFLKVIDFGVLSSEYSKRKNKQEHNISSIKDPFIEENKIYIESELKKSETEKVISLEESYTINMTRLKEYARI